MHTKYIILKGVSFMAQILPITTNSGENIIEFDAFYPFVWVKNMGANDVYAANYAGFTPGAKDTVLIRAGETVCVQAQTHSNCIYINGASKLECHGQEYKTAPVKYGSTADLREQVSQNTTDISDIEAYIGMYAESGVAGLYADFANNTYTRIAAAVGKTAGASFNIFPMYGGRQLCNVADDLTVNAWYGDATYTEDGSNGQVMIWQPKFYYRVVPLEIEEIQPEIIDPEAVEPEYTEPQGYHLRRANYYICDKKLSGFKCHPAFIDANGNEMPGIFISAYEGSIYDYSESKYLVFDDLSDDGNFTAGTYAMDTSKDKFCSIAGTHTITVGGEEVEVSGVKPASGASNVLTPPAIEAMCKNRGSGWHSENAQIAAMEQLLMIIEYAGFDTQTLIGKGIDSYASGSGNEASQTGSTASLGNDSGSAAKTIHYASDGTKTEDTTSGKLAVRYRGRENPWGNIWTFTDGYNIAGNHHQRGGVGYYCNDFEYAESKKDDNYISTGITIANASGYIKSLGWSEACDWMFIPTETGGTASRPVGDYVYVTSNLGTLSTTAFRVSFVGGSWNNGTGGGSFSWYWAYGVGYRSRGIGGRLAGYPSLKV